MVAFWPRAAFAGTVMVPTTRSAGGARLTIIEAGSYAALFASRPASSMRLAVRGHEHEERPGQAGGHREGYRLGVARPRRQAAEVEAVAEVRVAVAVEDRSSDRG